MAVHTPAAVSGMPTRQRPISHIDARRRRAAATGAPGWLTVACGVWYIAAAVLLPGFGLAHAQVPNAGQSIRDIETARPSLPAATLPDIDIAPAEPAPGAAADTGPRIAVRAFVIEGSAAIPVARLDALLADLTGRELGFVELQQAASRISAYYRSRGYVLARAYLPHQDIEDGIVRIAVVEGRYGQIELHNRSRVFDRALRQPLDVLHAGDIVHGGNLERSLMLLDDMAGVEVKGTLRPGTEPGTTDLVIDAEPGPRANGSLEVDNFGDPLTGRYRATGSLDVNAPLRVGDRFSLRGLTSDKHQRYYRAAYQLPIGTAATRVGVAYSDMHYRVGGSLADLGYRGSADVRSAFLAQPLVRSRTTRLDAQFTYENKHLHDIYSAFEIDNDKQVDLWTLGVTGNNQDDFAGGGRNGFSATVTIGRLRGNDALGLNTVAHTHGRFARVNVSALRLQALGARFQLYTQFSAQLSSRNLDASEKFSLGGPYGVRAYALGAGNGDQGWQASAELRYLAAPGWQVAALADTGRIQLSKQPWTRERNTVQLSSLGVGASWFGPRHQISLTAALPLGPAYKVASATRSPSVWIQAAQYF
ncbi:ShlB/FhaC/HecB family hemolysin secretion/activation protein [Burkholderia cenocepacia]|uniref:ShlB/FhaC/HecB family hemolysin secretion/activation protein n=1 Tax=Burkholderia cenocepacia TaxID=95486 RepID=UPI001CF2FA58|nr:ShlB/FhaC/HecB family hemolysin secretion/activation protein [Burkholderia cenocepacia]MCA7921144.1 ShlB/FhaC/HecB family hemolysin secretion/activation protein [Burkholderia cenocepacia]